MSDLPEGQIVPKGLVYYIMNKKFPKLEIIVFICGAVVMILELCGSRILAPYVGTSLYVWSALLGVILGALSLGYYIGGKLADKEPKFSFLGRIILITAINIIFVGFLKDFISAGSAFAGVKSGSIAASLILFAPPSVLLGMVSPYAIKLKLKDLGNTGNVAGTLYAFSTVGSIFGTFLAGFVLIPNLRVTHIIFGLSVVLFFTFMLSNDFKIKLTSAVPLLLFILWPASVSMENSLPVLEYLNTPYSFLSVHEWEHEDGRTVRELSLNGEHSSAMYVDSDDMVYEYTNYYHLDKFFKPEINNTLLLGGGAYSVARDFLRLHGQGTIDVVELDPVVTEMARKHFMLEDDERMGIFHEDARTFLNRNEKKYDSIYSDVFSSRFYIPWHVTTKESYDRMYESLVDDGVVIINTNTSLEGAGSEFLWAEVKTIEAVFPHVYVLGRYEDNPTYMQNVIIIATKDEDFSLEKALQKNKNKEFAKFLAKQYIKKEPNDSAILLDDFAPVEYYILSAMD